MPGLRRSDEVEAHRSLRLAVLRTPSLAQRLSIGDDEREVGGVQAAEDAVRSGSEAGVKSAVWPTTF